jgi:hypothetical protein
MAAARCVLIGVLALAPACFHPNYQCPRCGSGDDPSSQCPSGLTCNAVTLRCETAQNSCPVEDDELCYGKGLIKVCLDSAPTEALKYTGNDQPGIDTSIETTCTRIVPQANGLDLCVIAGTTIEVDYDEIALPGPPHSVIVVGTRALVLLATDTIVLQGAINASSRTNTLPPRIGPGAGQVSCNESTAAMSDPSGAGGGAGGGFGTLGGNGGNGDAGRPPAPPARGGVAAQLVPAPSELRGGCPGANGGNGSSHGGAGGAGGGAVYLIAGRLITILSTPYPAGVNMGTPYPAGEFQGAVYASGAAGHGGGADVPAAGAQGGGGGGTGGMIGLDAPEISNAGDVTANGAGGGGGAGSNAVGSPGEDGSFSNPRRQVKGGAAGTGGGSGGLGSALDATDPLTGSDGALGGGGGGGGGFGFILTYGSVDGALTSPPAVMH